MLITDLVPDHFEETFWAYNRPKRADPGQTNVRVFTYTITDGAQSAPVQAEWMACANMGQSRKNSKQQQSTLFVFLCFDHLLHVCRMA